MLRTESPTTLPTIQPQGPARPIVTVTSNNWEKAVVAMISDPHAITHYRNSPYVTVQAITVDEATSLLIRYPDRYNVMDTQAWQLTAETLTLQAIEQAIEQVMDNRPIHLWGLRPTPSDLPHDVALARLNFLAAHPHPHHADMILSLVETVRVARGESPLPGDSIAKQHIAASAAQTYRWAERCSQPLAELQREAAQVSSTLSDCQKREDTRGIAACLNELSELNSLIDLHPDNPNRADHLLELDAFDPEQDTTPDAP